MRPHHTRSAGGPTYIWHPSYSNPTIITEGPTYTYYIQTTNVPNGTTLYWSITHGTTSSADFSSNSGSFTVNNNFGFFSISPTDDFINDAGETFTLNVRTESTSGPVVLTRSITLNNATISATVSGPTSLTEGNGYWYTIYTTGIPNNQHINFSYFGTANLSIDYTANSTTQVYNGQAQLYIEIYKNDGIDTPEYFYFDITYQGNNIGSSTFIYIDTDVEEPLWSPAGVDGIPETGCGNWNNLWYFFCNASSQDWNNYPSGQFSSCHPIVSYDKHRDYPTLLSYVYNGTRLSNRRSIIFGYFDGSSWVRQDAFRYNNDPALCQNTYTQYYDQYDIYAYTCSGYPWEGYC